MARVESLLPEDQNLWGKMNGYQMVKHCCKSEEMYLGKTSYNRLFVGRLFGSMALKGIMKDESPLKRNQPTHPDMKISGKGNFKQQKEEWVALLAAYQHFSNPGFIHPFFGKMTEKEIGRYVYKHTDHHLRQFGR